MQKQILASIIIPVYNKCDYTKHCLESLVENISESYFDRLNADFEVIIVDNASTDKTKDFLKTINGTIKIITNDTNLGFSKACNLGAKNAEGKYIRQSGGKGQYGHCLIKMEPLERGAGYEFVDATVGGSIPKEYIQPINNGIKEARMCGVVAGYETVDFKVTVYDGSFHEVDSSEMAFKIAGSLAFKDGAAKADPVLLEPIMKVTVEVPDDYLGTVMGNLTSRRGILLGNESLPGIQRINAEVPLAEMFGYATDLRSQTQGRGTFVMEPLKYQEVPKSITEKVVGERNKK